VSRADDLADEFQRACTGLADYVAGLKPEQWLAKCANDEQRPVGVVAHHVTDWFDWQAKTIDENVAGRQGPPLPHGDFNEANAAHHRANPNPDQAETVELLRRRSAELADKIGGLDDAALDRERSSAQLPTVEQFVKRLVIGHVKGHEASIKETLSGPLSEPSS